MRSTRQAIFTIERAGALNFVQLVEAAKVRKAIATMLAETHKGAVIVALQTWESEETPQAVEPVEAEVVEIEGAGYIGDAGEQEEE